MEYDIFVDIVIPLVSAFIGGLVTLIGIIIKSFFKKDKLESNIDKYLNDIDELLLYRELLKKLKDEEVENTQTTRYGFIANRIARVRAEIEIKNLHYAIKDFKKATKHCMYIDKLGKKLDEQKGKR